MTLERLLVWAISIGVGVGFVLGTRMQPNFSDQLVLGILGTVLAVPVITVALGWLLGVLGDRWRHPV
ncbi:MAG: hypothetical protein ACLFNI_02940 [Natronomonas sp.]